MLEDINLHILYTSICGASSALGNLAPSEEREFELIWKGGCVPIGGNNSFPVPAVYATPGLMVRAVYTFATPEGSIWAEDARI